MTGRLIYDIFAGMNEIQTKQEKLAGLFEAWDGSALVRTFVFPSSGSNRKYYRMEGKASTAIGVIGEDPRENRAFLEFSKHFRGLGLPVPEIYAADEPEGIYLQEDLGNTSLFDLVMKEGDAIGKEVETLYRLSLDALVRFQTEGGRDLDYSLCFPVQAFSRQSMLWDLNYFKYYFLRPSGISYDEEGLEKDFASLTAFLGQADAGYFIYRDFQGRNIFVREGKPWFIDYQGGRKGPAQYDVASLLFQAKASLPYAFREKMLNHYMDRLVEARTIDRKEFTRQYYGFVLLRTLQVLGAYGYRGFFEQKPHFIESAGYALKNINWLLANVELPVSLPELTGNLEQLVGKPEKHEKPKGLTVDISSFSYLKYGYPKDASGHGGGFVFDCRALPNPGRHEEYKAITGRDEAVINFLKREQAVDDFLEHVYRIIGQAVDNYLVRGFDHLSVNFGCTGGQHRSVYCAEKLYAYLRENYRITVNLSHKMLD